MKMLKGSGLALVLTLALATTGARAEVCKVMRQNLAEEQIWKCTIAYWSGTNSYSAVECFPDADEGFRWVGARLAKAGRIITGVCRNNGENLRYRDWYTRVRVD